MATRSSIIAENSTDRAAWWVMIHGVRKNWTQLHTHMHVCMHTHTQRQTCLMTHTFFLLCFSDN